MNNRHASERHNQLIEPGASDEKSVGQSDATSTEQGDHARDPEPQVEADHKQDPAERGNRAD